MIVPIAWREIEKRKKKENERNHFILFLFSSTFFLGNL